MILCEGERAVWQQAAKNVEIIVNINASNFSSRFCFVIMIFSYFHIFIVAACVPVIITQNTEVLFRNSLKFHLNCHCRL